MASPPQTTPLSQLLGKEDRPSQMINQDPSGQFGNLPGKMDSRPVMTMQPSGMGQGISMPEGSSRKEFFGLKEIANDYKSLILVFAIVLILSSGMFASSLRPYISSSVGSDGRTTLVGSLIAAILGVVIFVLVKLMGHF
jgi:hypothetical protein